MELYSTMKMNIIYRDVSAQEINLLQNIESVKFFIVHFS